MKTKNAAILSAIIFISSSLGVVYFTHHQDNISEQKNQEANGYMRNAYYKQFTLTGEIHSTLKTPEVTHFPNEKAHYKSPVMLTYTQQRIPWHIKSDSAISNQNDNTINLYNNVVMHQPQRTEHPETTIKSSKMTIYTKKSLALNHVLTRVTRPNTTLNGEGVWANLKTGTYKLKTHSKGSYTPPTMKPSPSAIESTKKATHVSIAKTADHEAW